MTTALVLSGGGPLAVAWESGLMLGLVRAGFAPNAVDFILGTSAGALVGAQLSAGHSPEALFAAIIAESEGIPPPGAMATFPASALMKLPELFALSQRDEAGCVEVGSYAVAASTPESESAYVERMQLAIGMADWPDQPIGLVAVDVVDGKPAVLQRASGVSIAAAVAASCSLPGLSPPVSILGRRFMDGGMRSTANADLASGFDSVLVLSFHPPGPSGERIRARVAAQAQVLMAAGARVSVIAPDAASLAAIGPPGMDLVRRPEVARTGLAQGEAASAALAGLVG